nr:hypothetical protein [Tanacetum cinerariifolium]
MSKDPSIPRRNKVNWHYVRDDFMFSTIKLVSRHQTMQQFGALLPIELTNDEIRNSKAYKEYYAIATGEAAPKPKASTRRTKSSSDTSITPLIAAASPRLKASASKAKSLSALTEVAMTEAQQLKLVTKRSMQQMHISQPSGSGTDEGIGSKLGVPDVPTAEEEESFDPIPQTPEDSEDEGDGEEDLSLNIGEEERHDEEEGEDELYRDVNINQGRGLQGTLEVEDTHVTLTPVKPDGQQEISSVSSQFMTSMLNLTLDVGIESIFETTSRIDVQTPTSVAPLPITTPTMTSSAIATTTPTSQAPTLPTTIPSKIIQHLPSFGSLFCFDDRLRSLEEHFSEVTQTNQFTGASDRLRKEAQRENDEFFRTVDENIKKIIKEQVKEQVKAQVSKILPRIKQAVNEQLKAEVLTRSSHSLRTSYALVDAYKSDKIILDTYEETVTLKRRHDDDEDKDEEPSAGPDRGSKRRIEGKEPESASAPLETATKSTGRSTTGSRSRQALASKSAFTEEPHPEWFSQPQKLPTPDRDWNKTLPTVHRSIQLWISELAKQADTRSSFNELMDTPLDFSNFIINRLRVDTLTPELLAGPTYDLMKWSYYGHIKWIKDLVPRTMWIQEPTDYDKHALLRVSHWEHKRQQFYSFAINRESARDVYSKRRIIAVAKLKIVEWHSYKHLDWIIVRRDDDKLYKFKEGDFKSDETLIDIRTALDDRLKGIRMRYLPQTIWRKSDKDRAAAMIQAIDKRLKTMRVMRILERFVGGRLYEGDFKMLQRTI